MPPIFDTKWWGWGRADKSYRLPAPSVFWDFLNQKLGPLATSPRVDSLDSIRLPETRLTDSEIASLQDIVGEKNVSIGEPDRAIHSLGKSYPDLVRIRRGTVPRPTDAVIYPTTEPEVEAILRLAGERAWVVIPFGGGTSVVGGVEPSVDGRVVITADLRQLNRVLEIDTESRLASVQCGIRGPELERQLNAVGFTLGHFPQSFEFSTLGGWIATRSAGQHSTRYGKIETIVADLRVITPTGVIQTPRVPAAATGSDLLQILIGSEGNLGLITRATVRLQPVPRQRKFPSFLFHSFEEGVLAARELLQMGVRPAVIRLSDEDEAEMSVKLGGLAEGWKFRLGKWWVEKKGFSLPRSAPLILGFEGAEESSSRTLLQTEMRLAAEVMKKNGGLSIGESAGKKWHREQFELPYLRDLILDRAVMIDTLETATSWQNLRKLHGAIKQSLREAMEDDGPNQGALVLTHLSHAYPDGASLYYTFMARQKPGQELEQWQRVKNAATDAIVRNGGALSHQHGIGTMHKPWLRRYLGEAGTRIVSSVKTAVDPGNVMNPSVLMETETRTAPPPVSGTFSHQTRSSNIDRFSQEQFDLVIIGGGITGAGIARDAALRGMKVALVEKGDFASGTSSKSSGMIHGGLRYLKLLDIKMVKESLHEREVLLQLAPHLVQPRAHLIPAYSPFEKFELRVGMIGYELLGGSKSIPSYERLSEPETLRREPLLKRRDLQGGFVYYDCLVNDARLTLATLKSAAEHGAVIANYAYCIGLDMTAGAVNGIHFQDVLTQRRGTIRAKVVINATGTWVDQIRELANEKEQMLRTTKGVHIVVAREAMNVQQVLVHFTSDERIIFVVPSRAYTYIGTTDTDYDGALGEVHADAEDVAYLLKSANETCENVRLTERDVVSSWAGLRPLVKEDGRPSSISRGHRVLVNDSGLVSIAGGKLTTARAMAESLLDEVVQRFGDRFQGTFSQCRTAELPLYGGDIADFENYEAAAIQGGGDRWGVSPDAIARLVHHYGTDYLKVLALGLSDPGFLWPLSPDGKVLKGEVIYAIEDEMTMTLEDFMERRTNLMHFDPHRGANIAEEVADLMASRLGWDEAERQRQVSAYRGAIEKMMGFRSATPSFPPR